MRNLEEKNPWADDVASAPHSFAKISERIRAQRWRRTWRWRRCVCCILKGCKPAQSRARPARQRAARELLQLNHPPEHHTRRADNRKHHRVCAARARAMLLLISGDPVEAPLSVRLVAAERWICAQPEVFEGCLVIRAVALHLPQRRGAPTRL